MDTQDKLSSMKHRITLQEPVIEIGEAGEYTVSWSDVDTVWAALLPIVSTANRLEQLREEQLVSPVMYRIEIRYRDDVTTAMRIVFGERIFNIRQVHAPAMEQTWLMIHAEEYIAV